MEKQSSEHKSNASERSSESSADSSLSVQEGQATERFRDEILSARNNQHAADEPDTTQRTYALKATEQLKGQSTFLTFDNSIFADQNRLAPGGLQEDQSQLQTSSYEQDQLGDTNNAHDKARTKPETNPTKTETRDAHGNITHIDAQGNTTVISFDGNTVTYTGADGRGYVRVHTDRGWTQTNFGPSAHDNYSIERTYGRNGAYSDRYTYADNTRNHTRDVDSEGRVVVTDAAGLQIRLTGGSPEFQERALNQILDTPLVDRQRLQRLGATIHIVDQPRDVTEAARRIPPGAQGFYDHAGSRAIIIGEYNARGVRETDPEQQTRHEIGHALDHSFGSPFSRTSLSADSNYLRDLLDEDAARLSDDWRFVYESYLAPSNPFRNGRAELFADLYAAIRAQLPTERHLQLLSHFPRLVAQIRLMLNRR